LCIICCVDLTANEENAGVTAGENVSASVLASVLDVHSQCAAVSPDKQCDNKMSDTAAEEDEEKCKLAITAFRCDFHKISY